ncbi:MAG: isocitrate lyase/phosphoenolpyruvate mutase family protein [Rhodospirillales bacterium]
MLHPDEIAKRAEAFRALHKSPGPFVMPNPWDLGSARILAGLGFRALATTSAGHAYSLGRRDNEGAISRDEAMAHAADLVAATPLPVNGDLEKGYGDSPEAVAETIRAAAAAGLAGCSIEDATGRPDDPIFEKSLAVARIEAAVDAVRSLDRPFVLTARAENLIQGRPDLDDTFARLAAFAEVGAEVLYAPGLKDLATIARFCSELPCPFNLLYGLKGQDFSIAEVAPVGVARISLGSGLARAAYGALLEAGRELAESGSAGYAAKVPGFAAFDGFMTGQEER